MPVGAFVHSTAELDHVLACFLPPAHRTTIALFIVLTTLASSGGCTGIDGAVPVPLSETLRDGDRFMHIRLLGSLRLPADEVDGIAFAALSALAWDEDEALLYAVSDRGHVFHLSPIFDGDRLIDVERKAGRRLRNQKGEPLVSPWQDAEGLTLRQGNNGRRGDSELVISFEIHPRVSRFRPDGYWLGDIALPAALSDRRAYKNSNTSLEAIGDHPTLGLIVAPEQPMRQMPRGRVPWYTLEHPNAPWWYPLKNAPGSSLVDLEALADGSVLTLERAFVGLTRPLTISLRRARFRAESRSLSVEDIAVFDTSRGWLLDNFEGLAEHRPGYFFIISDDNENWLQSTLLVYFELLLQ